MPLKSGFGTQRRFSQPKTEGLGPGAYGFIEPWVQEHQADGQRRQRNTFQLLSKGVRAGAYRTSTRSEL